MSRVGKMPITLPSDVKANIQGTAVSVEGKLGKLSYDLRPNITAEVKDGKLLVHCGSADDAQANADFGTARARLNNMVVGVSKGWKRSLELNGVGFSASVQGQNLKLAVGFSHDVHLEIPNTVKCTVQKNLIELECPDRELLGTFAARIRKVQPPEPYLGKGIKYSEETIRRKAGKTGKK